MASNTGDDKVDIDWRGVSPAGAAKVSKTLEIKISLPNMPHIPGYTRAKNKISLLPRRSVIATVAIASIAIASVGGYYMLSGNNKSVASVTAQPIGPTKGTPSFPTVIPSGKNIEEMGGWSRISPPDRNAVFAYTDTIGSTPINVSQQPLPENFKTDPTAQIEQLAQSFSAGEKISAGGTTVYIGTSAKGPQSVIFNKSDLLILIKSNGPITNDDWTKYIDSLR